MKPRRHAPPPPREENRLLAVAKQLRLKKSFSQNFLINQSVVDNIVSSLAIEEGDTVLEIGAGAGFLTEALLKAASEKRAGLTAVEVDPRMIRHLTETFPPSQYPTLQLVHQDILKFDFDGIPVQRFKVVGNLPYQITSPILFRLIGELNDPDYPLRPRIQRMTLMVQKEVAERMAASPCRAGKAKCYNSLSIACQMWFDVTLHQVVPARDFLPAPKVDSGIVTLIPRDTPRYPVSDWARFSLLVRSAFSHKRKTIRNALVQSGFAPTDRVEQALNRAGIPLVARAEALSIETFGALFDAFS